MRVSEVYASSQGEGPNVGATTVFVRFGGCNLRCPGWPCDTQHAIDPAYRKEWINHSVNELFDRTVSTAGLAGARLITLTGGEPFLQSGKQLSEYVDKLYNYGYDVECFSNGTLAYPEWAPNRISFIMDWKLPGSGEDPMNPTRLQNIQLLNNSRRRHAVKFVIKDERDLAAAHGLWFDKLKYRASQLEVYYGKVWDGDLQDKDLVEYVMKNGLPWKLNIQVHNIIWPANERGR
jgi:7-carboxy-7-deazaguanine synthase